MLKVPTTIEQFEALINRRAFELANQFRSTNNLISECYRIVFTIKRKEFLDYVKSRFKLNELPLSKNKKGKEDGYYILKEFGNKYRFYYQERLVHFDECVLIGQDAVYEKYVENCLKASGTGLPIDWWE